MPAFPTPPLDSAREMLLAARSVLLSNQRDPFSRLQRRVTGDPSQELARQFNDILGNSDNTMNEAN